MISGVLRLMGVFMGEGLGHQHEDSKFREEVPLRDKIQTIRNRNQKHRIWGWKLPNTIYYLADVFQEIRNPHIITVYRNPFDVARSSVTHDGIEFILKRLQCPINHYNKMHAVIQKLGPCPLIAYSHEAILADKDGFLTSLADFCGLVLSNEQRAECLNFIDPKSGYKEINRPSES
jgi:hypothetical protein